MNTVEIMAVLNGWKVRVGCQEVVFQDVDSLCRELRSYLTNPEEVTKRYQTESVNSKWTHQLQPNAPVPQPQEATGSDGAPLLRAARDRSPQTGGR